MESTVPGQPFSRVIFAEAALASGDTAAARRRADEAFASLDHSRTFLPLRLGLVYAAIDVPARRDDLLMKASEGPAGDRYARSAQLHMIRFTQAEGRDVGPLRYRLRTLTGWTDQEIDERLSEITGHQSGDVPTDS